MCADIDGHCVQVQLDRLADRDKSFQEEKSGTTDKRPRLKACLEYVREGDVLAVARLDRPARFLGASSALILLHQSTLCDP